MAGVKRVAVLLVGVVLLASAATSVRAAPARRTVPTPTVTGPITGGVMGHPFGAAPFDLSASGYNESEYFVSGMATAYDASPVALASLGAAPAPLPQAPFTTRMVVRAPADPAKFNGTVLVEWHNVTSGYDVDPVWVDTYPELLRSGYAFVGVTAQVVGVNALHAYDPVRYAPLVIPGDQFSYDVFSQAVQAIRHSALPVQRVLATGDSQSGSTLDHYVNSVYPQVNPVIDGFLIQTSTGSLRADLDVHVLRLLSEREAGGVKDVDSAFYRQWEVAGSSHTDKHFGDYAAATENRDFGTPPGTWPLAPSDIPSANGTCMIGRFPKFYVVRTAVDALNRWVSGGAAPPIAPRVAQTANGIERDANGNAVGGIRTPAIDVPTAAYYGEGSNECAFTLGKTVPFDAAKLRALYPTHDTYVSAVDAATTSALSTGMLLPADADAIRAEAAAADIPPSG